MKRLTLISLACATALAISPAAFAQTYDFTFTSPTIDITNGVITISSTPVPEGGGVSSYDILSVSGNYTDTGVLSGLGIVNVPISLYPAWGTNSSQILSVSGWEFDNQFYPSANAPGTNGAVFDVGGLFVNVGSTGYIANLWAGNISGEPGSSNTYTIGQGIPGESSTNAFDTGIGISGSSSSGSDGPSSGGSGGSSGGSSFVITVPESGSLSMLVLSIVALAGGFFFKARHSGLLLNA